MGYLSKETVLKAYATLSKLSEDPTKQGATQKVSFIRHFLALDEFYKKNQRNCNTRGKDDKREYIDYVGEVCGVCEKMYTTNFYAPLKEHNDDFCVGSNFYSSGQVKVSLANPNEIYDYPQRGKYPLFKVQNGTLIRDTALYNNLKEYVNGQDLMTALAIWIVRNHDIMSNDNTLSFQNLRQTISNIYSDELADLMVHDQAAIEAELQSYNTGLESVPAKINPEDINTLFNIYSKNKKQIPIHYSINGDMNESLSYLTAIRTKPFLLLAGISGTGKSRIVRKLAQATVTEELQKKFTPSFTSSDRWSLHSPANFELIQVKPNWHNSMDVVGYLSNIPTPHYVFTPFIIFIIKAWLNPDVPFFLCVDEMNLAPVEEYFAEFLSAIESRGFENGDYITDPIVPPFDTYGTFKDESGVDIKISDLMLNTLLPDFKASDTNSPKGKLAKHLREKGLTLPKNLVVIGTVNMDETTFSFSRKVLDRAMSIEMNKVDYSSFLQDSTDDDLKAVVTTFENGEVVDVNGNPVTINQLLVDRHVEAKEVVEELGGAIEDSDARFVIDYLERINSLLEGTPFKLGYRVANEALIYLRAAQEFGISDRESALDKFTLMKILSRIEGDETKLKITDSEHDRRRLDKCGVNEDTATRYGALTVLTALRAIIADHLGEDASTPSPENPEESDEEEPNVSSSSKEYRASIKKIDSMISQLDRDHFVSFWS